MEVVGFYPTSQRIDLVGGHELNQLSRRQTAAAESRLRQVNRFALLVSDNVPVNSQRDAWVAVTQLLLHNSPSCTVCEQSTGCAVTH